MGQDLNDPAETRKPFPTPDGDDDGPGPRRAPDARPYTYGVTGERRHRLHLHGPDVVGESRRRSRLQGAGLLQDRAASGTTRSRRASPPIQQARHWRTTSRSTRPRTPPRSPTRTWRSTRPSSSCPRPVTSSNAGPAGRLRALHPGRRRLRRRPRGLRHRVRLGLVRQARRRVLQAAPGTPSRRRSRPRTWRTRRPRTCPTSLDPHRRVVRLPDQPARHGARPAVAWTRSPTPAARMGADHPITWCQDYDGGRSWYTGLGHTKESYAEPNFLKMLLGGIKTAAGVVTADCSAIAERQLREGHARRQHREPDDDSTSPRTAGSSTSTGSGDVKVVKTTGGTVTAGSPERLHRQRVRPARPGAGPGLRHQQLGVPLLLARRARTSTGCAGSRVNRRHARPRQREGHPRRAGAAGRVLPPRWRHAQFDHKTGDLWLATGDNTNPFASDGYAPIDEQPGRAAWDAQRTSGNTNDLRGKLLRITPQADGTYTVPDGQPVRRRARRKTRPEIYGMGFRNPFRIGLDPQTGQVMVGRLRPRRRRRQRHPRPAAARSSGTSSASPATTAGRTASATTRRTSTTTSRPSTSGPAFNCAAPVNDSPNNTGLTKLPAGDRRRRSGTPTPPTRTASRSSAAAARRWRARSTATTPTCSRTASGRPTGTARRSSVSGTRTSCSRSSSTRPAHAQVDINQILELA